MVSFGLSLDDTFRSTKLVKLPFQEKELWLFRQRRKIPYFCIFISTRLQSLRSSFPRRFEVEAVRAVESL
jgi:hypothetical protein